MTRARQGQDDGGGGDGKISQSPVLYMKTVKGIAGDGTVKGIGTSCKFGDDVKVESCLRSTFDSTFSTNSIDHFRRQVPPFDACYLHHSLSSPPCYILIPHIKGHGFDYFLTRATECKECRNEYIARNLPIAPNV